MGRNIDPLFPRGGWWEVGGGKKNMTCVCLLGCSIENSEGGAYGYLCEPRKISLWLCQREPKESRARCVDIQSPHLQLLSPQKQLIGEQVHG